MRIKRNIYAQKLPSRAKAVYIYLCDRADAEGMCFPGHKTIAADLGISVSTVKRAIADLEQAGCMEKTARFHRRNGRRSNLYQVWKKFAYAPKGVVCSFKVDYPPVHHEVYKYSL